MFQIPISVIQLEMFPLYQYQGLLLALGLVLILLGNIKGLFFQYF